MGAGHLRRALALADAVAARGARVDLGQWRPAQRLADANRGRVRAAPADQSPRHQLRRAGRPRWRAGHGGAVGGAAAQRCSASWPTDGRRHSSPRCSPSAVARFRGELLPLLAAARALPGPPVIAASVRDVLVSKSDVGRYAWMAELAAAWYDRVLVHGDERLLPFAASFPLAGASRTASSTPASSTPAPAPAAGRCAPAVLVSAGGGAVGTACSGRRSRRERSCCGSEPWLLVAGPNRRRRRLRGAVARPPAGLPLARHRADLPVLMGRCRGVGVAGRLQHGRREACGQARAWCWCLLPRPARTSRRGVRSGCRAWPRRVGGGADPGRSWRGDRPRCRRPRPDPGAGRSPELPVGRNPGGAGRARAGLNRATPGLGRGRAGAVSGGATTMPVATIPLARCSRSPRGARHRWPGCRSRLARAGCAARPICPQADVLQHGIAHENRRSRGQED